MQSHQHLADILLTRCLPIMRRMMRFMHWGVRNIRCSAEFTAIWASPTRTWRQLMWLNLTSIIAQSLLSKTITNNTALRNSVRCKAPFTLEIYFKILFRNKLSEFFFGKWARSHWKSNFRKPYVSNIADASFDVFKHWPIDQSQCSISEISSTKFHKIELVLNCKIKFRNLSLLIAYCSH